MKKIISIILTAMFIAGVSSICSFAVDGVAPGAIKDLKAYSAYKGVALEWSPVDGAASYDVYREGKLVKKGIKPTSRKSYSTSGKVAYVDKTGKEGEKSYSYYVKAVSSDNISSNKSNVVKKKSVSPLYISVTFNRARTLTSHDKAKKTRKFKKGQKVKADNFRFGKYIFRYKGNTYHVNYTSLRKFKANLNRDLQYSDTEALYFINTSGVKSNTKYLVWANLYTQRLYVFKGNGKAGQWKLYKNLNYKGVKGYKWGISSGKASTPSPAGMSLKIYKRMRSRRGVNYLSFYHSDTSLHGKVGNDGFDTLRSSGCIRNPDKYAMLIYKKLPIGTRVVVY